MIMAKYASEVVKQAVSWLGRSESDGSHKSIIDVYNSQKPLPRGYKVKYTDAWCAAFVSAVFVQLDYKNLMGMECSCPKMVTKCKNLGIFIEDESITPELGDIVFYDWEDNGYGDNMGSPNHVGIVVDVDGGRFVVVEGNYNGAVRERTVEVNAARLRGFARPKYDMEPQPVLKSVDEIAREVIAGKWGNGSARKNKLTLAGYDYSAVQAKVNELLTGRKSVETLAKEVIAGKWGNGKARKNKLTEAGYDYNAVQAKVNELLR